MEDDKITVRLDNETLSVPAGTTYAEIVRDWRSDKGYPALLVLADGRLRELHKKAERSCTVVPLTADDHVGMDTYKRSLCLLFLRAVHDVLDDHAGKQMRAKKADGQPDDLPRTPADQKEAPADHTGENADSDGAQLHIVLQFTNSNGYFFTLNRGNNTESTLPVDDTLAARVRKRMRELVDEKLPIRKHSVSTTDAREFFRKTGMLDKEQLFRYRIGSHVNLYSLGDYQDYFYGYMVADTSYLKYFDVAAYRQGIVLVIPGAKDYTHVRPFHAYEKIFDIQTKSEKWGETLGISSVADLNNYVRDGRIGHDLLVAEALQESNVAAIAEKIREQKNIKFVMIAGPSSSGKTTFSRRLSIQLSAHGVMPHPISLDNFYRDRNDCPRDENGEYDYECLEALDVPLIQKTLRDLIDGKDVAMPRFNFITGKPEYRGDHMKLGENDILVIEGIHGLNDRLIGSLPRECVYRIYISALTTLNIDEHNHISTTDGRLIRRMVRDYMTRGTNAQETIQRWPSVRAGEMKYIFPNQENADCVFNSALIYELSVLKVYAEPLLFQVPENSPEFLEAKRLLKFLSYFVGIPADGVPANSILREFIGGSCFDVY